MCVDILAPGRPITMPFMHEQIWSSVSYDAVKVITYCDCFITNDSASEIKQLRVHFSKYVALEQVYVESGSSVPSTCDSSWYGDFECTGDYESSHSRVTLRLHFEAPNHGQFNGRILKGSFRPVPQRHAAGEGLIPVAYQHAAEFMQHMEELGWMVLDLDLEEPLDAGDTGWLRLRTEAVESRASGDTVRLPACPLLGDSHHFLIRREVICPVDLRERIGRSLDNVRYQRWTPEVVLDGFAKPETLTRIEDHRITLVFPKDVDISERSACPHDTTVPIAPYPIPQFPDRHALHIITGSRINENRDVVALAKRILHYLRTVYEKATVEHLVNRFGADQQEAIGLLVQAMIKAGVLVEHRPEEALLTENAEPCYEPVQQHDERAKMLALRQNYARLVEKAPLAEYSYRLRELHPFRISFAMAWTAYNEQQRKRLQCLDAIVNYCQESRRLRGGREAVLLANWEYQSEEYISDVRLGEVTTRLRDELIRRGKFHVTSLFNVNNTDDAIEAIGRVLACMEDGDTFLFWFLGHAVPCPNNRYLHLLLSQSRDGRGLEYTRVNRLFAQHRNLKKIAVLDCCHAELATDEDVPCNTLIWPTAGRDEGASARAEFGVYVPEQVSGAKPRNFSFEAANILRLGVPDIPREVLSCRELFVRAASGSPYGYEAQKGALDTVPIAANAAIPEESLEQILQRITV